MQNLQNNKSRHMIIVGAKGHAREIFDIIKNNCLHDQLFFFDDISNENAHTLQGFPVLRSVEQVKKILEKNKSFCLGVGNPYVRKKLAEKFYNCGGVLNSVISEYAFLSNLAKLSDGVDCMPFSSVNSNSIIGRGTLINSHASIHHDCVIGEFTEIAPGSRILGGCEVGSTSFIGANAVVLPNIKIGSNVTIGAGTIVTKDLPEPGTYIGIPAKKI